MDLYTIVADCRGFRAVGQHQGASPRAALKSWLRTFRLGIFPLSKRTEKKARKELLACKPIGGGSSPNVWIVVALRRCDFLVHIIKTRKS
jgi:hypothetical protein